MTNFYNNQPFAAAAYQCFALVSTFNHADDTTHIPAPILCRFINQQSKARAANKEPLKALQQCG